MFRIRFHGRGGQGIKTASRILGTAFFKEGYEVQDAPRYGAERRGAPLFAYVRASKSVIHERGVIPRPDLVMVADETLVGVPSAGVLQGLDEHAVLAINTTESEREWRRRLNTGSRIVTLPAFSAEDPSERAQVSVVMAGAAARLVGVIGREALIEAIGEELAELRADVHEANVEKALSTFDALNRSDGVVMQQDDGAPPASPGWITLGAEDVDISAPTIHAGATSVKVKTGLWRTLRPVIDYGHCNRCNWICGSFCPDNAISVTADGWPLIDYDHCKGCMICVAQCPTHTIGAVPETDAAGRAMPEPPANAAHAGDPP